MKPSKLLKLVRQVDPGAELSTAQHDFAVTVQLSNGKIICVHTAHADEPAILDYIRTKLEAPHD